MLVRQNLDSMPELLGLDHSCKPLSGRIEEDPPAHWVLLDYYDYWGTLVQVHLAGS